MARTLNHIAPERQTGSSGGGGPEDDPLSPRLALRSQGVLTLAFGFALGIALVVLFRLIAWLRPSVTLPTFSNDTLLNLLFLFLFGFISGTLVSGIYNLLVVRRLNLFGLESRLD